MLGGFVRSVSLHFSVKPVDVDHVNEIINLLLIPMAHDFVPHSHDVHHFLVDFGVVGLEFPVRWMDEAFALPLPIFRLQVSVESERG